MIDVVGLSIGAVAVVLALSALLLSKANARQLADHLADHQALAIAERRRQQTDEHRIHTNGHHR